MSVASNTSVTMPPPVAVGFGAAGASVRIEVLEMKDGDQLLRAYSVLASLRDGLPQSHWLGERWVAQFNSALERIEQARGTSLAEFKVQPCELERLIESQREDPDTGEHDITYSRELSCERAVVLQRINAVLIYFTGLQSGEQAKIGFQGHG